MQLIQSGCPGETTQQVLYGGDHCYARGDSQILRAVAFLRAHQNQEGIVTLDLGFNDLKGCLRHRTVCTTCVNARMDLLIVQLPQIIAPLKAAAGPHVTFVGINHYNPYLATALSGPMGSAGTFAAASVLVINLLNSTLATVYGQNSIQVADVAAWFHTSDITPVSVDGNGTVGGNLTCSMSSTSPKHHVVIRISSELWKVTTSANHESREHSIGVVPRHIAQQLVRARSKVQRDPTPRPWTDATARSVATGTRRFAQTR